MRADDVAGNDPGRYDLPRHRRTINSREEGLTCVLMTWRAISDRPNLHHLLLLCAHVVLVHRREGPELAGDGCDYHDGYILLAVY